MHYIDLSGIHSCIFNVCMGPALNGSFVLQCFECCNTVKLHNGIMFDFCLGLSHVILKANCTEIGFKSGTETSSYT